MWLRLWIFIFSLTINFTETIPAKNTIPLMLVQYKIILTPKLVQDYTTSNILSLNCWALDLICSLILMPLQLLSTYCHLKINYVKKKMYFHSIQLQGNGQRLLLDMSMNRNIAIWLWKPTVIYIYVLLLITMILDNYVSLTVIPKTWTDYKTYCKCERSKQ